MWAPSMAGASRPKYLSIADSLAKDISAGVLAPGAQLPTQRDLADQLGVTVGTITRAYAEARRRGLITGEVGRGTFVRQRQSRGAVFGFHDLRDPSLIELAFNAPETSPPELRRALASIARSRGMRECTGYQPHIGNHRHRAAGAKWLAQTGLEVAPDEVMVTSGAQHAMLLAFSVAVEPGDIVLTEALVYGGMRSIARFLRVDLQPVAMDGEGMIPSAFADACRAFAPRAVYLTPTLQNPTSTIMPESRRREIAAIAVEHGVTVVEDDIYSYLLEAPPLPVSAFVGDDAYYLTSLSKSIDAGLRVGYLRAPRSSMDALSSAMMTTTIMAPSITAEVAAQLVETGVAGQIAQRRRDEVRERQELTREALGAWIHPDSDPAAMHAWVVLPEPWRAEAFVGEARARGVSIASPEMYVVGRGAAPHAVRISVGAVGSLDRLGEALDALASLLSSAPPSRPGV